MSAEWDGEDDYDLGPRAADLEHADHGFELCDECGGRGVYITWHAYPNGPHECYEYCDTCDGEGQVAIDPDVFARMSRNKREGRYLARIKKN